MPLDGNMIQLFASLLRKTLSLPLSQKIAPMHRRQKKQPCSTEGVPKVLVIEHFIDFFSLVIWDISHWS